MSHVGLVSKMTIVPVSKIMALISTEKKIEQIIVLKAACKYVTGLKSLGIEAGSSAQGNGKILR